EARIGQDLALVFRLEVIDVRSVAVDGAADIVPSAMHEHLAIALTVNELAHRLVDLPTGDLASIGKCLDDFIATSLPRRAHDVKDLAMTITVILANEAGPVDVVKASSRSLRLGPDIQQDKVAFLEPLRTIRPRLKVRITAMGVRSHDRRVL